MEKERDGEGKRCTRIEMETERDGEQLTHIQKHEREIYDPVD